MVTVEHVETPTTTSATSAHWSVRLTAFTPSRLLTGIVLTLLTCAALWIRVNGLTGWDGTLTVDESRLALAARGVLESGVPRLPSGWIYTRGLLATYLTAPSLALVGTSDFAVR